MRNTFVNQHTFENLRIVGVLMSISDWGLHVCGAYFTVRLPRTIEMLQGISAAPDPTGQD